MAGEAMTDIVEQLKAMRGWHTPSDFQLMLDAAEEIKALRAERDTLKARLDDVLPRLELVVGQFGPWPSNRVLHHPLNVRFVLACVGLGGGSRSPTTMISASQR